MSERVRVSALRVGGPDPTTLALILVPVAVVVTATALGAPPRLLAAALGALLVLVPGAYRVRSFGFEGVWLFACIASILAGEISAISFGGQSGKILWADVVLGVGIVVQLLCGSRPPEIPRAPFVAALIPFVAWSAIGLPLARDPLTGIAELKEWLVAGAAGACAVRWVTDRRRARMLLGVVALTGAAIALLMAFVALRAPEGFGLAVLTRDVDVPWGRCNYLAGMLALALPLALGLMGSARRWPMRTLWLVVALVNVLGLAVSASKGANLAVAMAATVVFLGPMGKGSTRLPRLAVLLVFALGAVLFVTGPLRAALEYRMQASALDYSGSERMALYRLAVTEGLKHPLFGIGLNNFSVASHGLHGIDTVPHNLELGFFSELGIPGLALALAWIVVLLRSALAAIRASRTAAERSLALGCGAAVLGAVIHNQVESTLYGEQFKLLLVAVAAAMWRLGLPDQESTTETPIRH